MTDSWAQCDSNTLGLPLSLEDVSPQSPPELGRTQGCGFCADMWDDAFDKHFWTRWRMCNKMCMMTMLALRHGWHIAYDRFYLYHIQMNKFMFKSLNIMYNVIHWCRLGTYNTGEYKKANKFSIGQYLERCNTHIFSSPGVEVTLQLYRKAPQSHQEFPLWIKQSLVWNWISETTYGRKQEFDQHCGEELHGNYKWKAWQWESTTTIIPTPLNSLIFWNGYEIEETLYETYVVNT